MHTERYMEVRIALQNELALVEKASHSAPFPNPP